MITAKGIACMARSLLFSCFRGPTIELDEQS